MGGEYLPHLPKLTPRNGAHIEASLRSAKNRPGRRRTAPASSAHPVRERGDVRCRKATFEPHTRERSAMKTQDCQSAHAGCGHAGRGVRYRERRDPGRKAATILAT